MLASGKLFAFFNFHLLKGVFLMTISTIAHRASRIAH
jgi:hypothetical protein